MFRIIPEGRDFSEYALLRGGESVQIRTALPADVAAVEAFLRTISPESLQMRFMGAVSRVARSVVETMCAGDPGDSLGLLAIAREGNQTRIAGLGNYLAVGVGGRAEVAFLVGDADQGRGIGTLVLERLAGIAAAHGFVGFEADLLAENQAMINVFRDSGFDVCQAFEGAGSLHVEFPLEGAAVLRERAELRDRIAAAHSLLPFFRPRAVAVIGASRDPEAIGSMIFRAIRRGGFAGGAYPVNRLASAVDGVRAFASVRELPEPLDLAIVAVPAEGVLEVAGEALAAGARALLVVTSGFAEAGEEGAARQRQLLDLVRSRGARLIGPNGLGLMNTDPEIRLNASLASALPPRGRIGFFSHSGALGIVILEEAARRGLGFSTFVSAGNRADVSGNDLLQFWEEDPATDVALLYLETFGNPRRFTRIARRLAYRKPVLCVKSARSRAGRDAAHTHTGAGPQGGLEGERSVEALFRQTGVIRAETIEEMFDVAALLTTQPLPRGGHVAIVSNSGGTLTIAADAAEAEGLAVERTIDLGPVAGPEAFERAVAEALESDGTDALIAIYAAVSDRDPRVAGRAIRRGAIRASERTGIVKPALLCLMGEAGAVALGGDGDGDGAGGVRNVLPSYRFPESAARALARVVPYAAFRRRPAGRIRSYDDVDAGSARREAVARIEAANGGRAEARGEAAAGMLRGFGLALTDGAAPLPPGSAIQLDVVSDPAFGPLVRLRSGDRAPELRITPLTDNDIRELIAAAGAEGLPGLEDLLGRLSAMIEDLPWLAAFSSELRVDPSGRAALGPETRMTLLGTLPPSATRVPPAPPEPDRGTIGG